LAEPAITAELVEKISKAARLNLTEEEIAKYTQQLSTILDAFKELNEVPTEGVEPSYHPMDIKERLRDDVPMKWEWDPLMNVEDQENGYIRGPRIK